MSDWDETRKLSISGKSAEDGVGFFFNSAICWGSLLSDRNALLGTSEAGTPAAPSNSGYKLLRKKRRPYVSFNLAAPSVGVLYLVTETLFFSEIDFYG